MTDKEFNSPEYQRQLARWSDYEKLVNSNAAWEKWDAFYQKYPESRVTLSSTPISKNRFNCD